MSINDKRVIAQEDITIRKAWVPNKKASNLTEPQWQRRGKTGRSTSVAGYCRIPVLIIGRANRQKIGEDIKELNTSVLDLRY